MNLDYTKIQDNVNKYRYGVKIGNYNEETFGMDIKQNTHKIPNSTMKDSFGLQNTLLNMPQQKQTEAEKEYYEQTTFNHKGLQNHLLLGHGQLSNFENRQLTSTYDLSYNQQVKPQIQIYSKYEPNKTQFYQKSKQEEVADKVQQIVPDIKQTTNQQRLVKKKEFTNTFNDNYKKIPLRK
ncbi:unnamed protein product [Paramecium pentaurelia]|uniref:Uncharacterized protein n=1 Tax=Paramecium pentaurelia TaxID=43138 RepID=A0A8S1SB71_9CILI|nr:unnamed protein product [Paramecium pentaurelia]